MDGPGISAGALLFKLTLIPDPAGPRVRFSTGSGIRPSTIYDTRAHAYMLAVYPPTRSGINCPYSEAVPIGIATQQLIPGPATSGLLEYPCFNRTRDQYYRSVGETSPKFALAVGIT